MLHALISSLAPHYCLSCGKIGEQICENCYFDIELSPSLQCFMCHRTLSRSTCKYCQSIRGVVQVVLAEREGVLRRLLDEYKFRSARGAERIAAQLLGDNAPLLPANSYIVPLPTASHHIRQRGFDHTYAIGRLFAALRGQAFSPIVIRRQNTVQLGSNLQQRKAQAMKAYGLKRGVRIDPAATYVILDDIVTSGSSMSAAVQLLKAHGATNIICLALLRQPWQE